MSSRFPPDQRYPPRERSPPRYNDRRGSSTYTPGYAARNGEAGDRRGPDHVTSQADVPRGPKALLDTPRGPGPGGGPPSGPRGGARFEGRGGYRDVQLRDMPPLGSERERSWRDREYDRAPPRRPSPRSRSPGRDYRDNRDHGPPRDIEFNRARRNSRDGPLSAGSTYPDGPTCGGPPFRGGFARGRGRGRGDWDHRDRGRQYVDERDTYRRPDRSRSRGPRWERDREREREPLERERDIDRRNDRRFERLEEERRIEREEREREAERYKRDQMPRIDTRYTGNSGGTSTGQSTPHPLSASSTHPTGADRFAVSDTRDREPAPAKRASYAPPLAPAAKEPPPRRDSEKADHFASRAEASRDKYGGRTSPIPPVVPAFGSLPTFKPTPATVVPSASANPSSNVAAPDTKAPSAPPPATQATPTQTPHAVQPPAAPKVAPAMKPDLTAAPTAPKALRPPERVLYPAVKEQPTKKPDDVEMKDAPIPAQVAAPSTSPTFIPSAPVKREIVSPVPPTGPSPESASSLLTKPWAPPPGPQIGQRPPSSSGPSSFNKPPSATGRGASPPGTIPSGPRAGSTFNTSPVIGMNVPTGPRADRSPNVGHRQPPPPRIQQPPTGPKALGPHQQHQGHPRSLQWVRPGAPTYGRPPPSLIPAKRDFMGEVQEREHVTRKESTESRSLSEVATDVKADDNKSVAPPVEERPRTPVRTINDAVASGVEELDMIGKPSVSESERSRESPKVAEPETVMQDYTEEVDDGFSDNDDDMDLDEDEDDEDLDFSRNERRFNSEKAHLEYKLIDLSAPHLRATNVLAYLEALNRLSEADLPVPEPVFAEKPTAIQQLAERADIVASAQPTLLTPKAEETEDAVMEADEADAEEAPPERQPSPEIYLPYLRKGPLTPISDDIPFPDFRPDRADFCSALKSAFDDGATFPDTRTHEDRHQFREVLALRLKQQAEAERTSDEVVLADYREKYKAHRYRIYELDKEKEAEIERQKSAEPVPERVTTPAPVQESRRGHRYNSELDLQRALEESEKVYKETQAREEREAMKARPDYSKEAVIPPMYRSDEAERRRFIDENGLTNPEDLTEVYGFFPPEDDFTEEEHKVMVQNFKEHPKKFGKLAEGLDNRNYKDCINHYYATKWTKEYKLIPKGKGKKGRARAAKSAGRPKANALMSNLGVSADVYDGHEANAPLAAVTDSGRPRRAAAPTFGEKEMDIDGTASGPSSRRGAKQTDNSEGPSERPAKRQRATKERAPRKGKNQAIAAAPAPPMTPQQAHLPLATPSAPSPYHRPTAASPPRPGQQQLQPSGFRNLMEPEQYRALEFSAAQSLSDMQANSQRTTAPDVDMTEYNPHAYYGREVEEDVPLQISPPNPRQSHGQAPSSRQGPSSYWSVPEQQVFPEMIQHFGTDFSGAAAHMGTKTATMVKNNYMRLIEGSRPDLAREAAAADERRKRGEDLGPPPAPIQTTKRRYEFLQPAAHNRLLAASSDPTDLEEQVVLPTATAQPVQASPPQYPTPSRFPPLAQAPNPAQQPVTTIINTSQQSIAPNTLAPATTAPPAPTRTASHGRGPPVGFFPESRSESRPIIPQAQTNLHHPQPISQAPRASIQQSAMQQQAQDPQYREQLLREQEKARDLQARYMSERAAQEQQERERQQVLERERQIREREREMQMQQNQPSPFGFHHAPGQPSLLSRPSVSEASPIEQKPIFAHGPPMPQRQSASSIRNLIDPQSHPPHPPHVPSPLALPLKEVAAPSPPPIEDQRHSLVFAPPNPVTVAPRPPQPPAAAPAPAPPRRSNVMALLNDDNDAPPPRKSTASTVTAASVLGTPAHSPAPSTYPFGAPPTTQPPQLARRDTYGEMQNSQPPFQRPPFDQRQSAQVVTPTPRSLAEILGREPPPQVQPRQDWGARASVPPSVALGSPQGQPLDYPGEGRSSVLGNRRAMALAGLNNQARTAPPSPPTHTPHAFPHSRTSSYSQNTSAPPLAPSQQAQQQNTHPLQPNPYAKGPQPAAHLQIQQNAEAHARNQPISFHHPGHQRQHSDGLIRSEDLYAREREREREREQMQRQRERERELAAREREQREREQQRQQYHRPAPFTAHPQEQGFPTTHGIPPPSVAAQNQPMQFSTDVRFDPAREARYRDELLAREREEDHIRRQRAAQQHQQSLAAQQLEDLRRREAASRTPLTGPSQQPSIAVDEATLRQLRAREADQLRVREAELNRRKQMYDHEDARRQWADADLNRMQQQGPYGRTDTRTPPTGPGAYGVPQQQQGWGGPHPQQGQQGHQGQGGQGMERRYDGGR